MSPRSRDLPRRSCHAVPGSSPRFIAKAPDLAADMVFLDLEDAVAPAEKEAARATVSEAVATGEWGDTILAVRVNDWSTPWTTFDILEVVARAGPRLDEIVLPKVEGPAQVVAADLVLRQAEIRADLPVGHVGIEAQIESPAGLIDVEAICAASPRLEAVVFGPADFAAAMQMPMLTAGVEIPEYPGDHFHYALTRILAAGRAHGLQVLDGPYLRIRDLDGLRHYCGPGSGARRRRQVDRPPRPDPDRQPGLLAHAGGVRPRLRRPARPGCGRRGRGPGGDPLRRRDGGRGLAEDGGERGRPRRAGRTGAVTAALGSGLDAFPQGLLPAAGGRRPGAPA
jgi:citrate lyase subunit beta/citryl-CoA lyase